MGCRQGTLFRSKGVSESKYEVNSRSYARHAEEDIERRCLGLDPTSSAKCIQDVIESTNESQRAEQDLIAQGDMALWAFWMLIITISMTAVTGLGVVFVWRTLIATQKMAVDARAIGRAQVRAYISTTLVCSWANDDTSGKITGINFRIVQENVGASPAFDVELSTNIEIIKKDGTKIAREPSKRMPIVTHPSRIEYVHPGDDAEYVLDVKTILAPGKDNATTLTYCRDHDRFSKFINDTFRNNENILIETVTTYRDCFGRTFRLARDFEVPVLGQLPSFEWAKASDFAVYVVLRGHAIEERLRKPTNR